MLDYVEVTGLLEKVLEFYGEVGELSRYYRFLFSVAEVGGIYRFIWSRGGRTFLAYWDGEEACLVDITPCGPGRVEVALVVKDRLQGRGIGTAVALDFSARLARMGFSVAVAHVSPANGPALSIARRLGASIRCRESCLVEYPLSP